VSAIIKRRLIVFLALVLAALVYGIVNLANGLLHGVVTVPSRHARDWTVSWNDSPLGYCVAVAWLLVAIMGSGWFSWRITETLFHPTDPRNAELQKVVAAMPVTNWRRILWILLAAAVLVIGLLVLVR
jgi:hypothetical protein